MSGPHIASAIEAGCEYFITSDEKIINKTTGFPKIKILNPVEFTTLII
ncbi:MAG TPA: hypothetical protein PKA90_11940 [Ignavibacteria bacterium]|nr:hypothetical protein [Ignavibacteria bacterium]HMR41131.1 hypothetical protein [Ignavibacteria bacterium]